MATYSTLNDGMSRELAQHNAIYPIESEEHVCADSQESQQHCSTGSQEAQQHCSTGSQEAQQHNSTDSQESEEQNSTRVSATASNRVDRSTAGNIAPGGVASVGDNRQGYRSQGPMVHGDLYQITNHYYVNTSGDPELDPDSDSDSDTSSIADELSG